MPVKVLLSTVAAADPQPVAGGIGNQIVLHKAIRRHNAVPLARHHPVADHGAAGLDTHAGAVLHVVALHQAAAG